jgi:hypothetical protein
MPQSGARRAVELQLTMTNSPMAMSTPLSGLMHSREISSPLGQHPLVA